MKLLVWIALFLAGQPPIPAGKQSAPEPPAYWKDDRFTRQIQFAPEDNSSGAPAPKLLAAKAESLPPMRHSYQQEDAQIPRADLLTVRSPGTTLLWGLDVARSLQRQTKASILLRGDWSRTPIVVPLRAGPAREFMDQLKQSFRQSRWFLIEGTWVLAMTPAEAQFTSFPPEQRQSQREKDKLDLLQSITTDQWHRMLSSGSLRLGDLTGSQRLTLVDLFRLDHYDPQAPPGNELSDAGLGGEGVYLQLTGSGKLAILEIGADGPDVGYMAIAPFYDDKGELKYGVPPPR